MKNVRELSRSVSPFIRIVSLIALTLFAISAFGETGVRGSPEQEKRGETLYVNYCQSCHGVGGVGEPPIPLGFRRLDYILAMPLDETSHAWHHGDENLVQTILVGNRRSRLSMPAWQGVLTEAQARDIVAYLKTFWSDRILACQGPKHMSCM